MQTNIEGKKDHGSLIGTIASISKVLISESVVDYIIRRHHRPRHCHYIVAHISNISSVCMTTMRTIITRCAYHPMQLAHALVYIRHVARCLSFLFLCPTFLCARAHGNGMYGKRAFLEHKLHSHEEQFSRLFVWKVE